MEVKTLVIGLDAATWDVITPLSKEDKLPQIKRLIENGVSGTLSSTIPPITPSAWTSIATGVNPGKHGFYDFFTQNRKTYKVSPGNYSILSHSAIWDLFSAYNRKVAMVNFPLAFPPPKIDSIFISGLGSPENQEYCYPPEVLGYLKSKGYHIHPRSSPKDGKKRYFNEVKELTRTKCEVVGELMEKKEWELFWVVFQGIDWIQHYLWDTTIDGENAVENFYIYMDNIVSQLLKQAKEDWNIIILSDHGFNKITGEIHLNNLLEDWGYLKRSKVVNENVKKKIRKSAVSATWGIGRTLPFPVKHMVKKHLPEWIYHKLRKAQNQQLKLHKIIRWDQTKAFSFGNMGRVYIHSENKYPHGTVKSKEYESLRDEIISNLKSIKDPKNGNPVVGEVFRKEEIYTGDQLENAPDIIFNPFGFRYMMYGDFGDRWYMEPEVRIADHNMDGILIMNGKAFQHGAQMTANVVDVTPTLLYLHDLPLLKDMDGQVLQKYMSKELVEDQEIKIVSSIASKKGRKLETNEEEEQEVQERLRDLGYL